VIEISSTQKLSQYIQTEKFSKLYHQNHYFNGAGIHATSEVCLAIMVELLIQKYVSSHSVNAVFHESLPAHGMYCCP
jgi:hypothetical protein